ncbi:prepilin peptidase [Demequina sp.]|uniref:prepilin peptidase n=1 Tax=Demequina sp. TaxID=2050685 RepID=UPI003A8C060B
MSAIAIVVGGTLGLALGSFANVVIHRVPAGLSVVSPASACPNCGHVIRRRHNVPVVGWLWLRRRCADCAAPISARYPLVEAAMGLLFAGIVALVGVRSELAPLLLLAFFGLVLSLIDLDVMRLPNGVVAAFGISLAVCFVVTAAVTGQVDALWRAGMGALGLGAFYFFAVLAYPRGMGLGDVKLSLVLGGLLAWFGWPQFYVGAFSAFLGGALFGIATMVVERKGRGVRVPFGPWMFVGAWAGVIFGPAVSEWYLSLMGLS